MSGFDHLGLRAGDFDRTAAFYEAALRPLGMQKLYEQEFPDGRVAGFGADRPILFIASGDHTVAATHLAFHADSRGVVDAFHAAALAAGGTDNGTPGLRPYRPNYYAAYVFDPDGNNVEAVCYAAE